MSRLIKIVKFIFWFTFLYLIINFVTPLSKYFLTRSIQNQINYLSKHLDEGYDDQLQTKYPEGKVFSNAILALSIIEYCNKNDNFNPEFSKIVDSCIQRLQSEKALTHFEKNISPEYGMFYNGWVNYVLVSYTKTALFHFSTLQKEIHASKQKIECELLEAQCDSIKVLESYSASCWPADNILGISSIHDSVIKQQWLDKLFAETKHQKRLINHICNDLTTARGSSSALITYFLITTN